VTSGGTLSHIPRAEVVAHAGSYPYSGTSRANTQRALATIIGATEAKIVSWHQAARTVPPGWRVTAYAADGVIEALEHEHHPWAIAVQWHPELHQ